MFDVDKFEEALEEYFDCQITLRALPSKASADEKAHAENDMENARTELRARLAELSGALDAVKDGYANEVASLTKRVHDLEPGNGAYRRMY